jgi:hypothetical protein
MWQTGDIGGSIVYGLGKTKGKISHDLPQISQNLVISSQVRKFLEQVLELICDHQKPNTSLGLVKDFANQSNGQQLGIGGFLLVGLGESEAIGFQ